jgi:plasmid stabilization system protein ParE
MNYQLKVLPEAKLDISEIIEWYNTKQKGLGKQFLDFLKFKLENIQENPLHYQTGYKDVRSCLIDKFPYQIHFWIDEQVNSIIVFAITHTSRNPKIWQSKR